MVKKKSTTALTRSAVPRAVYDPAIREVIAEGDVAKMKRVLAEARKILGEQEELKAAVKRLQKAIADS